MANSKTKQTKVSKKKKGKAISREDRRRKTHLINNRKRKLQGFEPLPDKVLARKRAKRKERKRRKVRWSKTRRKIKKNDGRYKWVKAKKKAGRWTKDAPTRFDY